MKYDNIRDEINELQINLRELETFEYDGYFLNMVEKDLSRLNRMSEKMLEAAIRGLK